MAKVVSDKRSFLDKLAAQLRTIASGSDAACLSLGIPPATPAPQPTKLAALLPPLLFMLYWQLLSASQAFDLGLRVSIAGAAQPLSQALVA